MDSFPGGFAFKLPGFHKSGSTSPVFVQDLLRTFQISLICVMRNSLWGAKLLLQRNKRRGIRQVKEAMDMLSAQKGEATARAVLCASLCNCRHTLRADSEEGLVEVALEHLRQQHPAAPLVEARVRRIVHTRAYDIEYATV